MNDPGKIVSTQTYDDIQRVISSFGALMANPEVIALLDGYVSQDEHGNVNININNQKPENGIPDPNYNLTSEKLKDTEYLRGRLEAIEFYLRTVVRGVVLRTRADRKALFSRVYSTDDNAFDHNRDNQIWRKGFRDGHGSILAFEEDSEASGSD